MLKPGRKLKKDVFTDLISKIQKNSITETKKPLNHRERMILRIIYKKMKDNIFRESPKKISKIEKSRKFIGKYFNLNIRLEKGKKYKSQEKNFIKNNLMN